MDTIQYLRRAKYLIGILLLGGILRTLFLFSKSIWFDEAASIVVAQMPVFKLLTGLASIDFNPPVYFLLLHAWMGISNSLWFAELLSWLFGIASIVVIYKLGNLLYRKPVGLYAAFILAISCLNIRYSQEIRMYSIGVFLGLLSTYFFISMLYEDWKSGGKKNFILYLITTIIGLYTHYYLFFLVISQNAYIFLFYKDRALVKKWIVGQLLMALAYAPWLPSLYTQIIHMHQDFWIAKPTLISLVAVYLFMADNVFNAAVLGILVLGGLFSLYRIHKGKLIIRKEKQNYFLLITLILPVLFSFILSLTTKSLFYERYFIFFAPMLFLLAAKGLSHVGNKIIFVIFILLLASFSGLCLVQHYRSANTDIGMGADFVERNSNGNSVIIHANPFVYLPFRIYHQDRIKEYVLSSKRLPIYLGGNYYDDSIYIGSIAALAPYDTVFIIDKDTLNEKVALAMQKDWKPIKQMHFGDVAIYVFEKKEKQTPDAGSTS